jgi:hypothetical protein
MFWESGGMALIEMKGTLLGVLEKAMLLRVAPGAALNLGRISDILLRTPALEAWRMSQRCVFFVATPPSSLSSLDLMS